MSYFKDSIDRMTSYVPGSQPAGSVIKLNTNENPYPPSPRAMAVFSSIDPECLRRYPDPRCAALVKVYAQVVGLSPDRVMAGNGSDNLIVMIARACGGPVVVPSPTFPFYESQAAVEGVTFVAVPMGEKFTLPVEGLLEAGGAVTFVACPNSPTGTAAPVEQLAELATGLAGRGLLVIDEAYADFAERDALVLLDTCENVVILRTLSKGYSLAGLRLGFALGSPDILAGLDKAREIYNVGAVPQAVGMVALRDQGHKEDNVRKIRYSRRRLSAGLEDLGWTVVPSDANFVLAAPPGGGAAEIHERLKEHGIFVRYFNRPDLEGFLRITVGTEHQNETFLSVLADVTR